ncbi:hypothetical protein ABZ707_10405 [Streptomyces sp. NPDC006923]|uniref:hypothetical protein n=1 Tax=Streptomyces sp. NPDC006923 TaxID=3155355 RepID=UPI0033DC4456
MRERDIRGVTRRKNHSLTRPDKKAKPAPDLIGRDFHAERPGIKAGRRQDHGETSPGICTCPPPPARPTTGS